MDKPGYTTTEFWFSVISVAAILLKLVGIDISTDDQSTLAVSLAGLGAGFLAVWGIVSRYIKSRSEVKQAQAYQQMARDAGKAGNPLSVTIGDK